MKITLKTQEQMLSDKASLQELQDAAQRNMTLRELRIWRGKCNHEWENKGMYDLCAVCDETRA